MLGRRPAAAHATGRLGRRLPRRLFGLQCILLEPSLLKHALIPYVLHTRVQHVSDVVPRAWVGRGAGLGGLLALGRLRDARQRTCGALVGLVYLRKSVKRTPFVAQDPASPRTML